MVGIWALLRVHFVDDEYAEAWPFGPVFPSLYHEFKLYGNASITEPATALVHLPVPGKQGRIVIEKPEVISDDNDALDCLRNVWEKYGPLTGGQLSSITHEKGSPWDRTVKRMNKISGGRLRRNQPISDGTIMRHYKELIKEL